MTIWTATGSYSNLTTRNASQDAVWSTSDSSILTISGGTGSVTNAGHIWGATVGVTATVGAVVGTGSALVVASDSSSFGVAYGVHLPQENSHWVALGLSPWGTWFGAQEQTGSLVGSGSAGFTLVPAGGGGQGVMYQQDVAGGGWLRDAIMISGSTGQRLSAAAASGPNPNATSVAFLGYIQLGVSIATTAVLGGHDATVANRWMLSTISSAASNLSVQGGANTKTLVGPIAHNHSTRVHPMLLIWNRTSGEIWGCTDLVIGMTGSFTTPADGAKGFGPLTTAGAPSASLVWLAVATGSVVEALCSHSASADFLARLGWNVSWKDCPTESGSIKAPFLVDHWKSLALQPWTATYNFQEDLGTANTFDRWNNYNIEGWRLTTQLVGTYHYNVPGWVRGGFHFPRTNDARSINTAVYGPPASFDPTGSFAILSYCHLSTALPLASGGAQAAVVQGCCAAVAATACWVGYTNTGVPVVYSAGASATGTVSIGPDRVHPWLLVYDKTNSRVKVYTDMEKLTGSFNALTIQTSQTASIGFAGVPFIRTAASGTRLWGAIATGSLAESLSDDGQASDFLKKLGWTIDW